MKQTTIENSKEYIGMWVTKNGNIRHELLPNNRYDEARGKTKCLSRELLSERNCIDYKNGTGFTANGELRNRIFYHAGMVLYKEN